MERLKTRVAWMVLVGVFGWSAIADAQPSIPKDQIPGDIPAEVRERMEKLYSPGPIDRAQAACRLIDESEHAIHTIPFLIAMFHDDAILYDGDRLLRRSLASSHASPFPFPNSPGEDAARAVGRISKRTRKPPIDALLAAMRDKNRCVRANAIMALGETGDLDGLPVLKPLVAALEDECPRVRANAARTLAGMNLEKLAEEDFLIKGLLACRLDKDRAVRLVVMGALGRTKSPRAVRPLIVVLANLLEDPEVRRRAADALGQIGDSQAVPHLITAMEDADWQVRFAALAVFSMVDDPQTLGDLIIAAMEDEAWRVRTRAAGAAAVLSRKGDPRAFDILIGALADRDANVRGAAARACAEAKDPRTVMRLTEVLRKDTDSYGRSEAAKALGKLGDPRAIEPLREAIREDEDNGVRTASRHALQQIREAQQMPPNK